MRESYARFSLRWYLIVLSVLVVCLLGGMASRAPESAHGVALAQTAFDPSEIWNLPEIQDQTTLNAEVVAGPVEVVTNRVRMEVTQVTFDSFDPGDGPIRIHGFVASPTGYAPGTLPALVYGHGGGMQADQDIARTMAALLKAVTISFSGPGQGLSTGAPSTAENWLNTVPDVRQSWLYQYAYSAMRSVTFLEMLPEVDPSRIGMTGVSAGGLMTWIANGVDDRLAAAYPIMATGDLRQSLDADSWLLLAFPLGDAGLLPDSPQTLALERYLDPIHYVNRQHAPVMLINGAQDEFFPINTTRSTYQALRAPEARLEVIYDWDHAYFAKTSRQYDTYNNTVQAAKRILGNAEAWFNWHMADGEPLPPDPRVNVVEADGELMFSVAPEYTRDARTVRMIYSRDRAYTFDRTSMRRRGDGSYFVTLPGRLTDLVYFVEVEFRKSVYLSSVPEMPEGFVPRIRPPQ